MGGYQLDTNICIFYLKGKCPSIRERLLSLNPGAVMISSVVEAELRYGIEKAKAPPASVDRLEQFFKGLAVVPFDSQAANAYARIRAQLAARGEPIGPNDLLIAATALSRDATLVTHNVAEFSRVDGLRYEDWTVG